VGSVQPQNWVQCNKCNKWRVVAPDINPDDLPEVWYCALNKWNTAYNRCAAPLEPDPGAPDGRSRRNNDVYNTNYDPLNSNTSIVKKTQWVQCERKNCKKWRKIPLNVDMTQLPELWYCEMNKWDPDRASCDGPEESD
jgi:hypothetical protein